MPRNAEPRPGCSRYHSCAGRPHGNRPAFSVLRCLLIRPGCAAHCCAGPNRPPEPSGLPIPCGHAADPNDPGRPHPSEPRRANSHPIRRAEPRHANNRPIRPGDPSRASIRRPSCRPATDETNCRPATGGTTRRPGSSHPNANPRGTGYRLAARTDEARHPDAELHHLRAADDHAGLRRRAGCGRWSAAGRRSIRPGRCEGQPGPSGERHRASSHPRRMIPPGRRRRTSACPRCGGRCPCAEHRRSWNQPSGEHLRGVLRPVEHRIRSTAAADLRACPP